MKLLVITLATFKEIIRSKILLMVLAFCILIIATSTLFSNVSLGDKLTSIQDFSFFSLSLLTLIGILTIGTRLLQKEYSQKTIFLILSKPISRTTFIWGKYLGLTGAIVLVCGLSSLLITVLLWQLNDEIILKPLIAFYLLSCETIIVGALTLFFSASVVTIPLVAILTLCTYIAGKSHETLHNFIIKYLNNIGSPEELSYLTYIFPDLGLFNSSELLLYSKEVINLKYLAGSGIYALFYSMAIMLLASIIFNHRSLP